MARRLKTKVSPTTWRLSEQAMQALVILESQQPDKPRAQLIGELLIARANNTEVEPTIEFAQLDDRELFSLRREIAENR
ncbi:MAG: hypothetical protein ABI540_02535, partial [Spartobacteria bacterium]